MLGTWYNFKQKEKKRWTLPKDYFDRKERFEIDLAINQLQREMYQRFIKKMEKKITDKGVKMSINMNTPIVDDSDKALGGTIFSNSAKIQFNNEKEALTSFLKDSDLKLFSKSSRGGVLFEVKNTKSDIFISTRSNRINETIHNILFKVVFIKTDPFETSVKFNDVYMDLIEESDFINEVKIQRDIFIKSLDEYLEPICPSIIYCEITTLKDLFLFFHKNTENLMHTEEVEELNTSLSLLQEFAKNLNPSKRIGILFMEKMQGFSPIASVVTDLNSPYVLMALFEIYRMYDLGYLHGDIHGGNLLIDVDYEYFDNHRGRVIIIDFGRSFKPRNIPKIKPNMENIVEIITQNIDTVIPVIGNTLRSVKVNGLDSYSWIEQFETPALIEFFKNMIKHREKGKEMFMNNVMHN
jgi:hypothetical protein